MNGTRRFKLVEHLSTREFDQAIDTTQKMDETCLVRRLCFVKSLYNGRTQQQAREAVGVSQPTSSRWARAWSDGGIEGLRPRFGGGRPPRLTPVQWDEFCELLEDGQPWTPQEIRTLIEDRYGVAYHPTHLAQDRADELNVEFVFILPYSPTLNAIEPLWKDLKREISPEIFADKNHFREFLTEIFLHLSRRLISIVTGSRHSSRIFRC
ncbi:helix-turn-helix domain-containing protein [Natronococcus roseus]|uniref:helix-turn-helix domain-containing protein n=1 Tax=Natronococcus roseus TaxID=1052014 RepID=UPI00374D077E